MRNYETIFIVAPSISKEGTEQLIQPFEELIKERGNLLNTVKWGRRSLAYEIKKFRDGIYVIFEYEGDGDLVKELERRFRLNDSILKYMTINTERKRKLQKKGASRRQAKADARSKRKAGKPSGDRPSRGGYRADRS